MKKVPLTKAVRGWDGRVLLVEGNPLTVKELLLQYVGTFESEVGKELILARKLGQKIYDSREDLVEIEEPEFSVIKKSTSRPRHIAIVMGFLLEVLEGVEQDQYSDYSGENMSFMDPKITREILQ